MPVPRRRRRAGSEILELSIGEAWDPALAGRFEFIAGRAPANAHEAMVSPGALARLDAKLGDTVTLTDPRTEFTIVGVLKSATHARLGADAVRAGVDGSRRGGGTANLVHARLATHRRPDPRAQPQRRDRVRPRPRHSRGGSTRCRRGLDHWGRRRDRCRVLRVPRGAAGGRRVRGRRSSSAAVPRRRSQRRRTAQLRVPHRAAAGHRARRRRRCRRRHCRGRARRDRAGPPRRRQRDELLGLQRALGAGHRHRHLRDRRGDGIRSPSRAGRDPW